MTVRIRDLPEQERPRERLAEKGAHALSSAELIAILLGSGTQESSAIALGATILANFGTLERLQEATLQELLAIKGIKMAKAVRLMASFALSKRVPSLSKSRSAINSPGRAFQELAHEIREEKVEVVCLLLRDARKGLISKETIGRGILNEVIVHPREVFHSAIRHRAHSLIVGHNHPSGDASPSMSDIEMTKALRSAGKVMGIELVDHIIIAKEGYFSFWQKGLLNPHELGY